MSKSSSYDAKTQGIKITLDKPRKVIYNFNSFIALQQLFEDERETSVDLDELLKQAEKGNLRIIRALLWAGLVEDDPTLTELETGRIIDPYNLKAVTEALTKAITVSMPSPEQRPVPKSVPVRKG